YKGSGPALSDLVAGHVDLMVGPLAAALPLAKAGRLHALGVASAKRNPAAPEIPTLDEAGMAGVIAEGWNGVLAPAGTPRDLVNRVNSEIAAAVKRAEVTRQLVDRGYEPAFSTPAQFGEFIAAEVAKWTRVVKQAGI